MGAWGGGVKVCSRCVLDWGRLVGTVYYGCAAVLRVKINRVCGLIYCDGTMAQG